MQLFFSNLVTVSQNVCVLFILIALGALCGRLKIINDVGAKCLSEIALRIVTPCVIINSFISKSYDPVSMKDYIIVLGVTFAVHAFLIFAARLVLFDSNQDREKVYRFALIFSNAGFMAIPLQQALLGDDGVFFGSAYVAGFNIVLWSFGVIMMSADSKLFSMKKILLNQGILAVAVGMILFVFSVPVPGVVRSALTHVSSMNTAVPMFVIGYYFAQSDFKSLFTDKKSFLCIFLRLVAAPAAAVALIYLCGMRGVPFIATSVAACTPCAAATTMFSAKYNRDVHLSARLVSLSTGFSILSMPVVVALCMTLGM